MIGRQSLDPPTLSQSKPAPCDIFRQIMPVFVNQENFLELIDPIKRDISLSEFVSVDCEFSGLGWGISRCRDKNIEQRYNALRNVVQQSSIFSLGLSFVLKNSKDISREDSKSYFSIKTYEFLMSCQSKYSVEPQSLEFLARNGFDINSMVKHGIRYNPKNHQIHSQKKSHSSKKRKFQSEENESLNQGNQFMESIFLAIFRRMRERKLKLLVHNGLMDIMYIYNSFYASLPENFASFVEDMASLSGSSEHSEGNTIFDTKFIEDYEFRGKVSYLGYVYAKYSHWNQELGPEERLEIDVLEGDSNQGISHIPYVSEKNREICLQFAYHGNCKLGKLCKLSHSMKKILGFIENINAVNLDDNAATLINSAHSAWLDSLMTAKVFLLQIYAINRKEKLLWLERDDVEFPVENEQGKTEFSLAGCNHLANMIYLIGKSIPLPIRKSPYSRSSEAHLENIKKGHV